MKIITEKMQNIKNEHQKIEKSKPQTCYWLKRYCYSVSGHHWFTMLKKTTTTKQTAIWDSMKNTLEIMIKIYGIKTHL